MSSYSDLAAKNKFECPEGLKSWPEGIPINSDGSLNVEIFQTIAEYFAKKNYALLVFANAGSTQGHAIDDIEKISQVLEKLEN